MCLYENLKDLGVRSRWLGVDDQNMERLQNKIRAKTYHMRDIRTLREELTSSAALTPGLSNASRLWRRESAP